MRTAEWPIIAPTLMPSVGRMKSRYSAEGLPAEWHGRIEGRLFDVFDHREHADDLRAALGLDGGEAERTVADHDGSDAVFERWRREAVPAQLRVEVGMDVDEAGRKYRAGAVDLFDAAAGDATDLGDLAVDDREVAFE